MRTAVVLGGSGQIGKAIARRLLGDGLRVASVARDVERLDLDPDGRNPPHYTRLAADLTTPEGIAAVAELCTSWGRLDLLALGSGAYNRSSAQADFRHLIETNVLGPHALLQQLRPALEAAGGLAVFLNSTQGLRASAGIGAYAATKHALRALADSFRDEVNASGIRVLSLYLGRTATEGQREIFRMEGRPYTPERLIQPEDIAEIVGAAFHLPRTAEITDLTVRPMLKT